MRSVDNIADPTKSNHSRKTILNETEIVNRTEQSMIALIKVFHKNINLGPEYICTCCDQLWCRSSVMKGNPSNYKTCPQNILELCITGVQSVDKTEWICMTCNCNLKNGKQQPHPHLPQNN